MIFNIESMPRGKPLDLEEIRREIDFTEKILINLRRKEQRALKREKDKTLRELAGYFKEAGVTLEELAEFIDK